MADYIFTTIIANKDLDQILPIIKKVLASVNENTIPQIKKTANETGIIVEISFIENAELLLFSNLLLKNGVQPMASPKPKN